MKNTVLTVIMLAFFASAFSQTVVIPQDPDTRVITTGMPFLLIAGDARSAGMGDMGVATSVDAFSQQYNSSKYAFSTYKQGFGISYTPYLSRLVNDIGVAYLSYYNRINERGAFGVSLKYFGLGEIEFVQDEFSEPSVQKPNEFALDASYALRLSDRFAMAVGLRFMLSDLKLGNVDPDA